MSGRPREHMILTAFMMAPGYSRDTWRMPHSRAEELGSLDLVTDLTLTCEQAKLDSVFFGDVVTAQTVLEGDLNLSGLYEPVAVMSALAARTSHIGLSGTFSTSFSLPYVTARQLNTADHLSNGRIGWNVVTSWIGGENFGLSELPHPADRYRRAAEYLDVVNALWDSWSDDAVINDRAKGQWIDHAKIREINHVGEFFQVKGPLQAPRSPQGRPVTFQAGGSPAGMNLGATYADVIYTAQRTKAEAIAFRQHMSDLGAAAGRKPGAVKILPGLLPIVGETQAEALDFERSLAEYIEYDSGSKRLGDMLGIDLSTIELDDVIPAELWGDDPTQPTQHQLMRHLALEDGYTVRQLVIENQRSGAHQRLTGSASQVADTMIDWFESGACDGFSLNPASMPESLRQICNLLVPELRDRGYFREEYEGTTLRENLGIERPGAWDQ